MYPKGNRRFGGRDRLFRVSERADRGGSLQPVELLRIAGILRCARNIKGLRRRSSTTMCCSSWNGKKEIAFFARARLSFAMRAICPEVRTDGQLNLIRRPPSAHHRKNGCADFGAARL